MKLGKINNLKKIAILLLFLIPLPNDKMIILSGIGAIFQFFNLFIIFLSDEFKVLLLKELAITLLYLFSAFMILNKNNKLSILGFLLSLLWFLSLSKASDLKYLEFIISLSIYILFFSYITYRIDQKNRLGKLK